MKLVHFFVAHWLALSLAAGILIVCAILYWLWLQRHSPSDTTQNGITIGQVKAFDNRSLALREEKLNASLEKFKVVDQNVTESLATIQEQTANETSWSLSLGTKTKPSNPDNAGKSKDGSSSDEKSAPVAPKTANADGKPNIGLAASDVLSNQLNLASQIFNLQMLYERSLSDRLFDGHSRLQTVLGFQVSITPPAGYEDCAAVVEIGVRMKTGPATSLPVSLVALMPQEKTYNVESLSTSSKSIEGSAVARVLTMGFTGKGEARQLFIHRDSDTIAFERDPRAKPSLFEGDATVFGWEFRPVLERPTVSPGPRQMLAVIALPAADKPRAEETTAGEEFILEVKTRSYWRHYRRKRQTTGPNWGWLPWQVDRSARIDSAVQEIKVPDTAKIQSALAPQISDIKWINSGKGTATVVVKGRNFFSGTKVIIGGTTHREEDGTLILKSDQALEFDTAIESLVTGDAVLSGRFGPSIKLLMPGDKCPFGSLILTRATIPTSKYSKPYLSVEIKGLDINGDDKDLTIDDLNKWPDPVLFVGPELVAMPYDFYDKEPTPTTSGTGTGASTDVPVTAGETEGAASVKYTKKYINVQAWLPEKALAENTSVSFRVPFCGIDYQSSEPISLSRPKVVRLGRNAQLIVFRIFYPWGFGTSVSIELDKIYGEGAPTLVRTSPTEFRFAVPAAVVSRFQNMIVRIGSAEPYLLPIPPEDKPPTKPTIDGSTKPPQIAKGNRGPVEWIGSGFEVISDIAFGGASQQFSTYANGTRLIVYLNEGSTTSEGKQILECTTLAGEKLNLALFVTKSDPAPK